MKILLILLFLVVVFIAVKRVMAGPSIDPAEAAGRVAAGTAVLIDVREPDEWSGGVAEPALLCSMSDLRGPRVQWKEVLSANKDMELIVYCASGARSGVVASMLRKEGFKVVNAGGFGAWRSAGLPVRVP
ncbi:MAG: rhodanese-like domain-containing protein [Chthoniobacterales bacterium]